MNYIEVQKMRKRAYYEDIIRERYDQPNMEYFNKGRNGEVTTPRYFDPQGDTSPRAPYEVADAAATYRGGYSGDRLAYHPDGKYARWHHWYDVPVINGKLRIPKIENAREAGNYEPAEGSGRILEYDPKRGYALHQYPYREPIRDSASSAHSSSSKFYHVLDLLENQQSPFSATTKANYRNEPQGASVDTPLQYAAYLNWRNKTGGKTVPTK